MKSGRSVFSSGLVAAATVLWTAGARGRAWLYEKGIFKQKRLRAKVISVGNISWGGTGKTPLAIWLASRLQKAGLQVSILTRGYGRASTERVKILPAGSTPAQAKRDGDEVQLYLRHLKNVPIGISASRYEAGRKLEEENSLSAHILDDGFQHWGLARDVDLLLIDVFSASKLMRESMGATRRADAILLTRCELIEDRRRRERLERLRNVLRRVNPEAQQFTVRTKLHYFGDREGNFTYSISYMRSHRTVAFCGVGDPGNFFAMLEMESIRPLANRVFRDHHRYTSKDIGLIEKLARENRAECILTTEKDLVNLPPHAYLSTPVFWAVIEPAVEEETRLLEWIQHKLDLAAHGLITPDFETPARSAGGS